MGFVKCNKQGDKHKPSSITEAVSLVHYLKFSVSLPNLSKRELYRGYSRSTAGILGALSKEYITSKQLVLYGNSFWLSLTAVFFLGLMCHWDDS